MNHTYKVIIAHPFQQHSYRTAAAIKKAGYLEKYITTIYKKEKSLTSRVLRFLRGDNLQRANARRTDELDDTDVLQFCELKSLVLLLLQRIDKSKILYSWLNHHIINSFNKKVAYYAINHNVDAVIMYDTLSASAFKLFKKKAPNVKLIIDMSAPYLLYMDEIFKEDLKSNVDPDSDILKKELGSRYYKRFLENAKIELSLADYFLVASTFTEKSLLRFGINKDKIFYSYYGIDIEEDPCVQIRTKTDHGKKINVIFVGRINQQKGALHLFKAIDKIGYNDFSFKFIGSFNANSQYYKKYKETCEFTGHVPKAKMREIYQAADVLVFPSLADGFGLSVIEALSYGVPVICSRNAGVSDLIIDGYNGFVVPSGSEEGIVDRLLWFNKNRSRLIEMSENARQSVRQYTWDKYDQQISKMINSVFNIR